MKERGNWAGDSLVVVTDFGVVEVSHETFLMYERVSRSKGWKRKRTRASERRAVQRIESLVMALHEYMFLRGKDLRVI